MQHRLAGHILDSAKKKELPPSEITFRYDGTPKISILEPYIGKGGELLLSLFTIKSLDQEEDHLIFSAVSSDGTFMDEEAARRLFSLTAQAVAPIQTPMHDTQLTERTEQRKTEIQRTISERNAKFFEAEAEKLDNWAEDLKVALEREIKEIDKQIREIKRATTIALSLEEKLAGQKQIRTLEGTRNAKRKALFDAQDEIDRKRDELIEGIEGKLVQGSFIKQLFAIRWQLR
jgi:adenine-specific DNA-methyltransferase